GRLTSITNPAATITYTRDTYGRATAETTRLASGEETRHTIELSATGMVTGEHLTLPTDHTITTGYGRNAAGEITSSTITQHTTATTDGSALRLPTDDADTGRVLAELTYTTNTRGHRATTAIDNLVRTVNIDARGRITGDHTNLLDSATPGGLAPVAGRDFTWQADSTLTAITDQLRGTTSFTVDAIGRATSATRTPHTNHSNPSDQGTTPPQTTTHTPARAGTPAQPGSTTGVSAQENYSFTPAGVLASTADGVIDYHNTLPVKVGRTTYTYDDAGRITRTVTKRLGKKPLVHHFYYATGEQPIGFSSSDAPGVGYRYTYDGLGRRVAKDTINTTTGEVTHRDVFTHTGNQLAAVTTTVDNDSARVGEGYVWTTDPATGETHGQIALTNGTSGTTQTPANPAAGWSQARVDATFYALVCDLAGAPQELINTTTGVVEGHTTQTLHGKRTWTGRCTSPLLFAGQYEDVESGWAYNRFRYYNPTLGAYNAQDPLGLAPRLASAQGYVDHAAFWVDIFGLMSHISANKAAGEKFEANAESIIREKMGPDNWAKQVTTRVNLGEGAWKNSRADFIIKGNDEQFHFVEIKSGNAKLTEGQQLVQNELAKDGGAVEMRSARTDKTTPLGTSKGSFLTGQFHTFYMDDSSHVAKIGKLLDSIS
ncbi:RHS repeat-associated core domain-containing protein, partial [Corynebacterium sp. ACRQK]|uniref:RHS repeat-associated core domain-containing protein n=1 Tax=Corynebacterium sp. ACRQK TaxID=2918190 RepID=UPI001EF446B2